MSGLNTIISAIDGQWLVGDTYCDTPAETGEQAARRAAARYPGDEVVAGGQTAAERVCEQRNRRIEAAA